MRGAAGSSSAGGARAHGAHVSMESRNRAGVAGGDYGHADVHTRLCGQRQKREGRLHPVILLHKHLSTSLYPNLLRTADNIRS